MANKDVAGYILMENDNSIQEVSNLEVFDKNHLFYCRFNTILQSLDCVNRNGREYNGDAIVASLSTSEINELIAHNKFKGEAGHPVGQPMQRIATVDPKCTCHRITKWWRDGELIRGTIETLDDGLFGTKLTKSILQGEDPSFSYRGFAQIIKKDGHPYVATPPRCIAYDEVNLPSHKEAYAVPGRSFVDRDVTGKEMTYVKEGVDASRIITAKDMSDFMESASDACMAVCESFDLDPASFMGVTNGGRSAVYTKNKSKYVVTLEQRVARDVAYYFSENF